MAEKPHYNGQVAVCPMAMADINEVVRIERHCFTSHWTANAFLNELGNRAAYYNVARWNGCIIAYAGMWCVMDEAHITSLGVLTEHRRRRIGERLLLDLLREARKRGARRATLEVRPSNAAAIRLYEKHGFRTVAIRRGYYTDTREDALVMWLDDLKSLVTEEIDGTSASVDSAADDATDEPLTARQGKPRC